MPHYRQYARNNIFIGGPGGTFGGYANGSGKVIALADADLATQDLDHDAYGSTSGSFAGRIGSVTFSSLAELQEPDHGEARGPGRPRRLRRPRRPTRAIRSRRCGRPNLRISATSEAADAGAVLPNVNDGFAGAAPDLGAYEAGAPLPVYGPDPEAFRHPTLRSRCATAWACWTRPPSGISG